MSEEKNLRKEEINITGMTCQNCVNLIQNELSEMPGTDEIKVSLVDNKAIVKFDSEKTSLEDIKKKIKELGYNKEGGKESRKKTILKGIGYGLIPHIGCIAFIIGSILGVTLLMNFFKPLLMNRYFFHVLIAISLVFATFSSALYLKKNRLLSTKGAKKKWKYLSIMYGSTIGINLVLFMLIFPLLANVGSASITGNTIAGNVIKLSVDIPCPGHAPLISEELQTIEGVEAVNFNFPNKFDVLYTPLKTSKQEILSLEVFSSYPAEVLEESVNTGTNSAGSVKKIESKSQPSSAPAGSCSGGCGSPTCGSSSGGSCGGGCGS